MVPGTRALMMYPLGAVGFEVYLFDQHISHGSLIGLGGEDFGGWVGVPCRLRTAPSSDDSIDTFFFFVKLCYIMLHWLFCGISPDTVFLWYSQA